MSRKNESILDLLVEYPWWVSVMASAGAFIGLRYVLPTIDFGNPLANSFVEGPSLIAPIAALVLLIPAPIAALNSWRKRKLLDRQKGVDSIRALGWREFEQLVGEAYRRRGCKVIENTAAGPDDGVDLVLKKDGSLTLVQCKQWRSTKVGVNIIRELFGVMTAKHASSGILITSGVFTQEAKDFAAGKPIELIDGTQLCPLIGNVQKQEKSSPNLALSNICPRCGAELVVRTAKRGPNPGEKFWGCSDFPKCRFTKPVPPGVGPIMSSNSISEN